MIAEWFSGSGSGSGSGSESGSGSGSGSGFGQVLTSGPLEFKRPKRQNFPQTLFENRSMFLRCLLTHCCLNVAQRSPGASRSTWSELQHQFGGNVSFFTAPNALTNSVNGPVWTLPISFECVIASRAVEFGFPVVLHLGVRPNCSCLASCRGLVGRMESLVSQETEETR